MDDKDRERLVGLEARVDYVEDRVSQVVSDIRKLFVSVSSIDSTLHKVYYLVVGAVVILMAQEFGLLAVLKKAFL